MIEEPQPDGRNDIGRSRTPVRRAVATYGTNVGATGASLVNLLIVARVLGPTGRGEIAFLIVIGGLTTMLASLGVADANANIGGHSPEAIPRLATNSVLLSLVLGTVGAVIVATLALLVSSIARHADRVLLWFTLGSVPLQLLGLYLKFLLQADYRFTITNVAWFISPAATAALDGLLAIFGVLTVQMAMVCWVLTTVSATLLLVGYVRSTYGFGRPDLRLLRKSLSFGIKTHFGRTMSVGNYRADQWLLGAMAGAHALGLYSVAVTLSEGLFYVPGVITLIQRPDLVRATPEHAAELASRLLRRAMVLTVCAGGALFLAAPVLCLTLFGQNFDGSIIELRALALGAMGIVALDLLSNAVIAQGEPLLASGADGGALVVTVVLNLVLIPWLGGLGSAIATSAAYTFGGVVMTVIFLRVLHGRARDLIPRRDDLTWYWRKAQSAATKASGRSLRHRPKLEASLCTSRRGNARGAAAARAGEPPGDPTATQQRNQEVTMAETVSAALDSVQAIVVEAPAGAEADGQVADDSASARILLLLGGTQRHLSVPADVPVQALVGALVEKYVPGEEPNHWTLVSSDCSSELEGGRTLASLGVGELEELALIKRNVRRQPADG